MTEKVAGLTKGHWSAFLFAGWMLAGCATLFSEGTDTVTFNTNVDEVKVFVDGSLVGTTPLTRVFKRKLGEYHLKFVKEGYETQEFDLAHEFNYHTGMLLDLTGTATTLTPMGVNALSGNLIKYTPTDYHVEMVGEKTAGRESTRRRADSKRFAALSFDTLRRAVASGQKEPMDALAGSFYIPSDRVQAFRSLIDAHREELLASENGLVFWEKVNRRLAAHPQFDSY